MLHCMCLFILQKGECFWSFLTGAKPIIINLQLYCEPILFIADHNNLF